MLNIKFNQLWKRKIITIVKIVDYIHTLIKIVLLFIE